AAGLACSACASRSVAPAAMLDMRELPDEPDRRNERLDSTQVRPGTDSDKPLPPRARQVETAAATAAAFLGMLFSKSQAVLLGGGGPVAENALVESRSAPRRAPVEGETRGGRDDAEPEVDPSQLVPWVKLPHADEPSE